MHFEVEINKNWLSLCDSNVANCEEALAFCTMNLKVAQYMITMLVKQFAQMKSRVCHYFDPLLQLRPFTPFGCAIKTINAQPCPVCGEEFYCYDICIASHSLTHIIHGVWWHSPCFQENARGLVVKKCFRRIDAFHSNC